MAATGATAEQQVGKSADKAVQAGSETAAPKAALENRPGKTCLADATDHDKSALVKKGTLPECKIDGMAPASDTAGKAGAAKGDTTATAGAAKGDTTTTEGAAKSADGAVKTEALAKGAEGTAAAKFAAIQPDVSQYPTISAAVTEAKASLDAPSGPNRNTVDKTNQEANQRADQAKAIIAKAVLEAAKAGKDEGTRLAAAGKPDPDAQDKAVKGVEQALKNSVLSGGWRPQVTKTEDGKYVVSLDNGQPKTDGKNLIGASYVVNPDAGTSEKASAPGRTVDLSAATGEKPVEKAPAAPNGGEKAREAGEPITASATRTGEGASTAASTDGAVVAAPAAASTDGAVVAAGASRGADAAVPTGAEGTAAAKFAAVQPDTSQYPLVSGAVSEAKASLDAPSGPNRNTVDQTNQEANQRADQAKAIIATAVLEAAKAGKDEGTRLAAAGKPDPEAQDKAVKNVEQALSNSVLGGRWKPVVTKTDDGKYVVSLDNGQPKTDGKNLIGASYVVNPEAGTAEKANAPGRTSDLSAATKPEGGEVGKPKDSGDILDESGADKAKKPGERKPEDEIQAATAPKQTPVLLSLSDLTKVDNFIDKYQGGKLSPEDAPKPLSPEDKTAVKAAVLAVQSADKDYLKTIVPNGSNGLSENAQAAFSTIMKVQKAPVDFYEDKANKYSKYSNYSNMRIGGSGGSLLIENHAGEISSSGIDAKGQIMGSDKSEREKQAAKAARGIGLTATIANPNEW